jgi:hypothetical protein
MREAGLRGHASCGREGGGVRGVMAARLAGEGEGGATVNGGRPPYLFKK